MSTLSLIEKMGSFSTVWYQRSGIRRAVKSKPFASVSLGATIATTTADNDW
jgi:hypothetical protein